MTITLTSKEFNEAVSLWLEAQGFSPDNYNISTRTIAGRSDGPLGTRIEVTLDAKPTTSVLEAMGITSSYDGGVGAISISNSKEIPLSAGPILAVNGIPTSFSQRASQGHSDE